MKLKGFVYPNANIFTTGMYKGLVVEILLNFLMPYHFLDDIKFTSYNSEVGIYVTYSVNDVMGACQMLRAVSMFVMMFSFIRFNSPRSERLA